MKRFASLFERFLEEGLASEEAFVFIESARRPSSQRVIKKVLKNKLNKRAYYGLSVETDIDAMFQQVLQKGEALRKNNNEEIILPDPRAGVIRIKRIISAAAILVLVISAAYFLFRKSGQGDSLIDQTKGNGIVKDVLPTMQGTTLSVDNSVIQLDKIKDGSILKDGNTEVVKSGQQITYSIAGAPKFPVGHNILETHRGGSYAVSLSDGTKVWLNSASTLTYPTIFAGNERQVTVSGEAYFEVAHDSKPFILSHDNVSVEVLGTHFNINTYDTSNGVITTLLEGSIKMSFDTLALMLKPGQQGIVTKNNGTAKGVTKNLTANEQANSVIWRKSLLVFKDAEIESIMKEISKWYDIEPVYEGKVTYRYNTIINRTLPLSEVLKAIGSAGGVQFVVNGKKVIVKSKKKTP